MKGSSWFKVFEIGTGFEFFSLFKNVSEILFRWQSDYVQGCSQNLTAYSNAPIHLDRNKAYKIALVNANIWYGWYNIDDTNNMFKYNDIVIKIPSGKNNIEYINRYVKKIIERNGDNPAKEAFYKTTTHFIPNLN